MKDIHRKRFLNAIYTVAIFLGASVMLLWSFNTLSALFGGPVAQCKHAIAALALSYILGRTLHGGWRHEHRPMLRDFGDNV